MVREIQFKAKTNDAKREWVYGYLGRCENAFIIEDDTGLGIEVDGSTICQYLGIHDSQGNRIYEGDLLQAERYLWKTATYVVTYLEYEYTLTNVDTYEEIQMNEVKRSSVKVIGNVFDETLDIK